MEFYKFDVECTNRSPSTPTRGVHGPDRSAARIALPTANTGPPPQLPSSSRDERSRQQDYIDCRDQGFKKSLGIRRRHAKSAHNREWWDSLWSVVGRAPPVGGCLFWSAARSAEPNRIEPMPKRPAHEATGARAKATNEPKNSGQGWRVVSRQNDPIRARPALYKLGIGMTFRRAKFLSKRSHLGFLGTERSQPGVCENATNEPNGLLIGTVCGAQDFRRAIIDLASPLRANIH
jgi:hypothetical protein